MPELYIKHLVGIFRQVRRVLRDDGTLWCNIAGSYAGGNYRGGGPDTASGKQLSNVGTVAFMSKRQSLPLGFKPKDWVPIPWMLGMALQRDGWWLRSPIIWAKGLSFCETYSGSVMPESVSDRPTTSYEYLLLLTKSKHYFYDQNAVRESLRETTKERTKYGWHGVEIDELRSQPEATEKMGDRWGPPAGRNLRNVWVINPEPLRQKHYAAYPSKLVEPCIKAGTSEHGRCPECGKGWERITEKIGVATRPSADSKYFDADGNDPICGDTSGHPKTRVVNTTHTLGWRPGCSCYDDLYRTQFPKARRARKRQQRDAWADGWWERVRKRPGKDYWGIEPCMVADPFSGSGTTVMVALRLGRWAIGIELSEEYCQMARRRIINDNPMFNTPGEATE